MRFDILINPVFLLNKKIHFKEEEGVSNPVFQYEIGCIKKNIDFEDTLGV